MALWVTADMSGLTYGHRLMLQLEHHMAKYPQTDCQHTFIYAPQPHGVCKLHSAMQTCIYTNGTPLRGAGKVDLRLLVHSCNPATASQMIDQARTQASLSPWSG